MEDSFYLYFFEGKRRIFKFYEKEYIENKREKSGQIV